MRRLIYVCGDAAGHFGGSEALCGAVTACFVEPSVHVDVRGSAAEFSRIQMTRSAVVARQRLPGGWTGDGFIRGLLQLVSCRGHGAWQCNLLQAHSVSETAGRTLATISTVQMETGAPSSIAAQPGAAASIASGMRAGFSQLGSSSSGSSDPEEVATQANTLVTFCVLMGQVACSKPPQNGTWASVMMRMAPLRELSA